MKLAFLSYVKRRESSLDVRVTALGVQETVRCTWQVLPVFMNRDTAQCTWCVAVFSTDVLAPSAASTLKMEAESSSETLGNIFQTRQYRNNCHTR